MWISLAVASAVLLGLYDLAKKHALRDNAVLPTLLGATVAGLVTMAPVFLLQLLAPGRAAAWGLSLAPLTAVQHGLILLKAAIVASSWVLAYFAMKHLPISIAAPIRASAPVWTLLGAVLWMGERPTGPQWAGLAVIFASYYAFSLLGLREGIVFHRNKWVFCAVGATLIGAASALYDKVLIQRMALEPVTLQAWFSLYLVVLLGAVVAAAWWPRRHTSTAFRWRWSIPLIGALLIGADLLYFRALAQEGALLALISALRRSSVVISFAAGGLLFGEANRRRKALALSGVLAGVLLILLK